MKPRLGSENLAETLDATWVSDWAFPLQRIPVNDALSFIHYPDILFLRTFILIHGFICPAYNIINRGVCMQIIFRHSH